MQKTPRTFGPTESRSHSASASDGRTEAKRPHQGLRRSGGGEGSLQCVPLAPPSRVVSLPLYTVQFRTEPCLSDEARAALDAAGIQLVGSHGGGTVPPDGNLPDVDTHTVSVDAENEDAAGRALTEALEGKTVAFELMGVEPTPAD